MGGHTPEQRDQHPMCGAKKKNSDRCRAFAGQGTDHAGIGPCKFHGGSTPNHNKRAVKIEAQRAMVALGAPIEGIKPHQALLGVLRATAGHVAYLHAQIGGLADLSEPDAEAMIDLYGVERDRLTRIAEACAKAGYSEVEIELTRQAADGFTRIIEAAVENVGGWTPKQRAEFGAAFRTELAKAVSDAPGSSDLYGHATAA